MKTVGSEEGSREWSTGLRVMRDRRTPEIAVRKETDRKRGKGGKTYGNESIQAQMYQRSCCKMVHF